MVPNGFKVKWLAEMAHETNRAYAEMIGDHSHLPWSESPDWQKASAIDGVIKHLNNPHMTPEDSHKSWLEFKKKDGWKYGPVKDLEKKEHPCMVPYCDLPITQRMKDYVFAAVIRAADRMWMD